MAQLSGLYAPAAALENVGSSISDMMKTWAGLKIQEAKMELEGKQADINLARVMGEMEVSKAKAGLETAKLQSEERKSNREMSLREATLGYTVEHQREMEAQGREQLQISREAMLSAKQLHDLQANVLKRQEEKITGRKYMEESFMSPVLKQYLEQVTPETLDKEMPRAEWAGMEKSFKDKNPKFYVAEIAMRLKNRHDSIIKALNSLPRDEGEIAHSEEIAKELTLSKGGLYDVITQMQKLQMVMDTEDETAEKVAASISKDPTTGETDPIKFQENLKMIMDARKQMRGWMSKQVRPEDIKGFAQAYYDAWTQGKTIDNWGATLAQDFIVYETQKNPQITAQELEKQAQAMLSNVTKKYGKDTADDTAKEIKRLWNLKTSGKAAATGQGLVATPEEIQAGKKDVERLGGAVRSLGKELPTIPVL